MTGGGDGVEEASRWLAKLSRREDLSAEEADGLVAALIEGSLPDPQAGALLTQLSAKGESVEELVRFAAAMRLRATPFLPTLTDRAIDLCGTGGAAIPTFNVSTVSAFVVAAAGVPVAKHGNVSTRGPCGSSDLLEALGLPIRTSVAFAEESYRRYGLAFLHAPLYHSATREIARIRRSLGTRTIFNLLGPLTNPSSARTQVVGCFSTAYAGQAVAVLRALGVPRSMAIHGLDGTDEPSPTGLSEYVRSREDAPESGQIDPVTLLAPEERAGGWEARTPTESAAEARRILSGGAGSTRGAVLLTAGAALWTIGRAPDLAEGVREAREVLDSGSPQEKMLSLQALSIEREWV